MTARIDPQIAGRDGRVQTAHPIRCQLRTGLLDTGCMGDLVVRRLDGSEWAVLRDTRLAALRESPDAFLSTAEHEAGFTREIWTALARRRAVAFAEGRPVGVVGWSFHDGGFVELIGMWVGPDHRGGDAASALVQFVRDEAIERDQELRLGVRALNRRAAAFYRKAGFIEMSREQHGSGFEVIWMTFGAGDPT